MSIIRNSFVAGALVALFAMATPLLAQASPLPPTTTPVTVTWAGVSTVSLVYPTLMIEEFLFTPITDVVSFTGIDRGTISYVSNNWSLQIRLDNDWYTIFAGLSTDGLEGLSEIPGDTFSAATLDGIRFFAVWDATFTDLANMVFSFERIGDVVGVPEPASLPLFAAALGALGLAYRRRGEAQG